MTGRPSLCMALAFASTRRVADSAIAEIRVDSRVVGLAVSAYPQAYSRGWGGWVCWALYARHPNGPIPAVGRETPWKSAMEDAEVARPGASTRGSFRRCVWFRSHPRIRSGGLISDQALL